MSYNGLFGISPSFISNIIAKASGKPTVTDANAQNISDQPKANQNKNTDKLNELKRKMDELVDKQMKKDTETLNEVEAEQIKGLNVEKQPKNIKEEADN